MLARVALMLTCLAMPISAFAQSAILTVLDTENEEIASYTLEDLDSLDQTEFQTINAFIDEVATFSGPLVRDVLAASDIEVTPEGSVEVAAINDYAVGVPYEDILNYDVILATRMNGEEMSIRDKGPIWVMYPISDFPELSDSLYSSRLVWQVDRLKLVE